jgi:hypothetical protein
MNQTPTIEFILPKWVIFATGKIKIRIAEEKCKDLTFMGECAKNTQVYVINQYGD